VVQQKPVTIKWQIIFTFIPFLNLYAFYKIQKLRLFLCFSVPVYIACRFLGAGGGVGEALIEASLFLGWLYVILTWMFICLAIGLPIWFVLKWSKQWNEKFS